MPKRDTFLGHTHCLSLVAAILTISPLFTACSEIPHVLHDPCKAAPEFGSVSFNKNTHTCDYTCNEGFVLEMNEPNVPICKCAPKNEANVVYDATTKKCKYTCSRTLDASDKFTVIKGYDTEKNECILGCRDDLFFSPFKGDGTDRLNTTDENVQFNFDPSKRDFACSVTCQKGNTKAEWEEIGYPKHFFPPSSAEYDLDSKKCSYKCPRSAQPVMLNPENPLDDPVTTSPDYASPENKKFIGCKCSTTKPNSGWGWNEDKNRCEFLKPGY